MRSRTPYNPADYRQLNIRCTVGEYEAIRVAAALDGKSVSRWMREILFPIAEAATAHIRRPTRRSR